MARPRAIKSTELTETISFKTQICAWDDLCVSQISDETILQPARTTDTIDDESLEIQGLFFALLRHSAGGKQPGFIVAGGGKLLNLKQLARYLRKQVDDIMQPLRRLIDMGKIKLLTHSYQAKQKNSQKL